jgi:D-glycero-D-manno-heptose 1,7-bisphosphate phosphatase
MGGLRPAVFLDRDGTLNRRPPPHCYVTAPELFEWLDGAPEGVAKLANAGYLVAVVSNQRGVARGLVTMETLRAIERTIQDGLRPYGAQIVEFRYCVHDLDAGCACRKPSPGMLVELAAKLDLDLERSWMIGDSETDVTTGRAAGCRTALVGAASSTTAAELLGPSLLAISADITAGADHQASASRSNSATSAA